MCLVGSLGRLNATTPPKPITNPPRVLQEGSITLNKPKSIKPWCYISGPYTKGDTGQNVNTAMSQWAWLKENYPDILFVCPHWSHLQHMLTPLDYEEWIEYDLDLLSALMRSGPGCVIRLSGESEGADTECEYAKAMGIPVVKSSRQLTSWFMTLPE